MSTTARKDTPPPMPPKTKATVRTVTDADIQEAPAPCVPNEPLQEFIEAVYNTARLSQANDMSKMDSDARKCINILLQHNRTVLGRMGVALLDGGLKERWRADCSSGGTEEMGDSVYG